MSQSITWDLPDQEITEPTPDLSVVIVSWNVRVLLEQCLSALHSPDVRGALNLEIIVVDNASRDGSAEAARSFADVRVIETGENLGYGKGNNLGLACATGRHLLVLNPDTVPKPGSLQASITGMEALEMAGIVAPRLLNPDGTVQPSAFHFPTLTMALIDLFPLPRWIPGRVRAWLYSSRLNGRYPEEVTASEPFRIDHPLGACMLLRREAYAGAGGFDTAIHMYAEEIDLAMRYLNAGWECWQVPLARVIHFGGQSTKQVPDRMFVELWRSRLYLYEKYYSGRDYALLRIILAASQTLAILGTLLGRTTGRINRQSARKQLRRAGRLLAMAVRA